MTVIRAGTPTDAAAIARVHVATWRSTYPGVLPVKYLLGLSEAACAKRWRRILAINGYGNRTYVAEGPQGIVGFGSCGTQRSRLPDFSGEFYALYLLDEAQGQGLGRQLMAVMAGDLVDRGVRSALVWVLRDNPTHWFYERLGGTQVAQQRVRFAGTDLVQLAYGWRDLVPLARQPSQRT